LTGYYLFNGRNNQEIMNKNKRCQLDVMLPYLEKFSPECKDLLLKMLSKEPNIRPTAQESL
jgi:serine/threonine protein kinase